MPYFLYFVLLLALLFFVLLCFHKKWRIAVQADLKKISVRTLNRLIQVFDQWKKHLELSSWVMLSTFYELTPSDDVDKDRVYSSRLRQALDKEDVKNIAVAGPYGSGKSSIIKTFQKNNVSFRYLNVSLAAFKEDDKKISVPTELVEISILQQILYHVRHQDIPGSRFKRIKNLSERIVWLRAVAALLLGVSLIIIIKQDLLNFIPGWKVLFEQYTSLVEGTAGILVAVITVLVFHLLIKTYSDSKFQKISLTSGELEMAPATPASILNKHFDEILYFFEVTKFNVVIFEDLDRFGNPEIFIKLREINNLINNAQQVGRKVTFIYALRDEVFKDEQRTKFFDFIIPVIPVINVSNSSSILFQWREKEKMADRISVDLLNDVGLYIDDMRLLKNIMNEFSVYSDKLKGFTIKYDNLFSLIIYKNKYPDDFSELYNNRGKVATLFADKPTFIADLSASNKDQLSELKIRLQQKEESVFKNIKELRAVYLNAIMERLPTNFNLIIDQSGNAKPLSGYNSDLLFPVMRQFQNIRYNVSDRYSGNEQYLGKSFREIEAEVDPEQSYEQRASLLAAHAEESIDQLKLKIEQLHVTIEQEKNLSMAELLARVPIEQVNPFFGEHKLLAHLIRNGHIDEDFQYYISEFHEGTLSKAEYDYLLSIKNQQPLKYDYQLKNLSAVLAKLRNSEFYRTEVLNNTLIDFFWGHPLQHQTPRIAILQQLSNKSERSLAFIDQYLEHGEQIPAFVKDLGHAWSGWWQYLQFESQYSEQKKDSYILLFLQFLDLKDLQEMNYKNSLSEYISRKADFFEFIEGKRLKNRIKEIIDILLLSFDSLIVKGGYEGLLEFIYQGDYYELNEHMVNLMAQQFGELDDAHFEMLQNANLTVLRRSEAKQMVDYIQSYLQVYVDQVFLNIPTNVDESEEVILSLLNDESLDLETRKQVIDKEDIVISFLTSIPQTLWSHTLETSKLVADWLNLVPYFSLTQQIDSSLFDYLVQENHYQQLSRIPLEASQHIEASAIDQFIPQLIVQNELPDEAYRALIKSIPVSYAEIDVSALAPEKIIMLIEEGVLAFSLPNFTLLQKFPEDLHLHLVFRYPAKFLETMSAYPMRAQQYNKILLSTAFSDEEKLTISLWLSPDLFVEQPVLAKTVSALLVHRPDRLGFDLLMILLNNLQDLNMKITLLLSAFFKLGEPQITGALQALGGSYAELTELSKVHRLPNSARNILLLQKLEEVSYISSFSLPDDDGEIRIHSKRSR